MKHFTEDDIPCGCVIRTKDNVLFNVTTKTTGKICFYGEHVWHNLSYKINDVVEILQWKDGLFHINPNRTPDTAKICLDHVKSEKDLK